MNNNKKRKPAPRNKAKTSSKPTGANNNMRKKYFHEILFVFLVLATIFTGLSLFSYDANDPSHSNIVFSRYEENISNIFGKAGAYTADFLGTTFGWTALLIPFGIIYALATIVKAYRRRFSNVRAAGGITAMLLFLITLAMLSGLITEKDPFFPDKTCGGLLGVTGAVVIQSFLGKVGGIIFCIFVALLMLFGMLRISMVELIGNITQKVDDTASNIKSEGPGLMQRIKNRFTAWAAESKEKRIERAAQKRAEKEERDRLALEEMMKNAEENDSKAFYMKETPDSTTNNAGTPTETDVDTTYAESDPVLGDVNTGPNIVPPFTLNNEPDDEDEDDSAQEPDTGLPDGFPDKSELLTVAKLEEMLAEHERKLAEKGTADGTEESDIDIFEELIKDAHQMEKAPSSLKNKVTGIDYNLPFELLELPDESAPQTDIAELRAKADMLLSKLRDFNVDGNIREIRPGPVVTLFELEPAPGIKISKIANLENDLALAMSAISIRIIAPIPGKAAVGIEIPNEHRVTVKLRELLETKEFKQSESPLAIAFGKDISGKPYFSDLRVMPHLLVAGTTGSGKSVCINTIICSILYKSSPEAVKFVMIDPKMVELNVYNGIPHLAAPVVTDPRKAAAVLNNVVKEMENRYKLLSEHNVRNIESFNKYVKTNPELEHMPYMVVIVDEFGDLMMVAGKEVEAAIIRIAQLARAVGIHLVLATQRPSVNVITGIIKANLPSRIAFRVSSKIDSRTILDQNGAELLLGRGDSLFIPPGTSFTTRIHGCFVSEEEVKNIVDDLKRYGEPEFNMALLEEPAAAGGAGGDDELDSRYEEAVQIAREKGEASISMIQRYLRIGYNRAARIVESMEANGLITASDGTSKPRKFIGD